MSRNKVLLCLSDKAEVLRLLDEGASIQEVARKFKIHKSTVCSYKRKKERILQTLSDYRGAMPEKKSLKPCQAPLMEKALYKWLCHQQESNISVNAPTVRNKAIALNNELQELSSFQASNGWYLNFKRRFGVGPGNRVSKKIPEDPGDWSSEDVIDRTVFGSDEVAEVKREDGNGERHLVDEKDAEEPGDCVHIKQEIDIDHESMAALPEICSADEAIEAANKLIQWAEVNVSDISILIALQKCRDIAVRGCDVDVKEEYT